MRTVRPNTFETNSSSAHCFVCADNEAFARFVNGELFADGFGYKGRHDATLIDADTAYIGYDKYFLNDVLGIQKDSVELSKETVLWFLRHPKEIEPFYDGSLDGKYVVDEMPQRVKDECAANYWGVANLICWMEQENAPLSYATLVEETSNFEHGFDDYDSVPPTEKDGKTSCYAVWYY